MHRQTLREHELDIAGNCFGFVIRPREGINPLIEMYIEDDEYWHYVTCFDSLWLTDIENICRKAKESLK